MNGDRVVSFLRRLVRLVPIALVLSGITGCTANGFVVTGKVIDGETGKPIPNAWVHQEWTVSRRIAFNWNGSTTRDCAAEQVTKTDAKGKFRFEKPPRLHSSVIWESTGAYLTPLIPGYELDYDKSKDGGESHQVVVAKKIVQEDSREIFVLSRIRGLLGGGMCMQIDGQEPILSQKLSNEVAEELVSNKVTLDELVEIYRVSMSERYSKLLGRKWELSRDSLLSDPRMAKPYLVYRAFLDKAGDLK